MRGRGVLSFANRREGTFRGFTAHSYRTIRSADPERLLNSVPTLYFLGGAWEGRVTSNEDPKLASLRVSELGSPFEE